MVDMEQLVSGCLPEIQQDNTTNRKPGVRQEAATLPLMIRELFQKRQAVFRSKWSRCRKTDQYLAVDELAVKAYLVKRAVHE
jgi:hypothetical protein